MADITSNIKHYSKSKENATGSSSTSKNYYYNGSSSSSDRAKFADALTNTHTLWGQDFNGTQDVSGDMTGVGTINMSGDLNMSGALNINGPINMSNGNILGVHNIEASGDIRTTYGFYGESINVENGTMTYLSVTNIKDCSTIKTDYIDVDKSGWFRYLTADNAEFKTLSLTGTLNVANLNVSGESSFEGPVTMNTLDVTDKITASNMVTDTLTVTGKAHFFEVIIDKIKAAGGSTIYTPADGFTVLKVEEMDDAYRLYYQAKDSDGLAIYNTWETNDQAFCQTFNMAKGTSFTASNKRWWRLVTGTGQGVEVEIDGVTVTCHYIDVSKTDCDTDSDVPAVNDEVAMLGNRSDTSRQSAIYISAYNSIDKGLIAPLEAHYTGINDYNLSSHRQGYKDANGERVVGEFVVDSSGTTMDDALKDIYDKLNGYDSTLNEYDTRITNNADAISSLNSSVNGLTTTIEDVNIDVTNLTNSVNSITSEVNDISESITNLNSYIDVLDGDIDNLNDKTSYLSGQADSNSSSINDLKSQTTAISGKVDTIGETVESNSYDIAQLKVATGEVSTKVTDFADLDLLRYNMIDDACYNAPFIQATLGSRSCLLECGKTYTMTVKGFNNSSSCFLRVYIYAMLDDKYWCDTHKVDITATDEPDMIAVTFTVPTSFTSTETSTTMTVETGEKVKYYVTPYNYTAGTTPYPNTTNYLTYSILNWVCVEKADTSSERYFLSVNDNMINNNMLKWSPKFNSSSNVTTTKCYTHTFTLEDRKINGVVLYDDLNADYSLNNYAGVVFTNMISNLNAMHSITVSFYAKSDTDNTKIGMAIYAATNETYPLRGYYIDDKQFYFQENSIDGITPVTDIGTSWVRVKRTFVYNPTQTTQAPSLTIRTYTYGANVQIAGIKVEYGGRMSDYTEYGESAYHNIVQSYVKQTAEEIQSTITDTKTSLQSQITQQSDEINSTITDVKNELQSSITQTESNLNATISSVNDSLQSQINLSYDKLWASVTDADDKLQASITLSYDKLNTRVTDVDNKLQSNIDQSYDRISSTVTDVKNSLQSSITQTADSIIASVEGAGLSLTNSKFIAKADNFEIQNSSGETKFSIDSDGNIIGQGQAHFYGDIYSENKTYGTAIVTQGSVGGATGDTYIKFLAPSYIDEYTHLPGGTSSTTELINLYIDNSSDANGATAGSGVFYCGGAQVGINYGMASLGAELQVMEYQNDEYLNGIMLSAGGSDGFIDIRANKKQVFEIMPDGQLYTITLRNDTLTKLDSTSSAYSLYICHDLYVDSKGYIRVGNKEFYKYDV